MVRLSKPDHDPQIENFNSIQEHRISFGYILSSPCPCISKHCNCSRVSNLSRVGIFLLDKVTRMLLKDYEHKISYGYPGLG